MEQLTAEERLKKAEHASFLATFCVVLCFVASCGASFTVLLALPLSIWGMKLAREALDGDSASDLTKAYALPARNIHVAVIVYSGLIILFVVSILTLYGAVFAAIIAGTL